MNDIQARTAIVAAVTARDLTDWGRSLVEALAGDPAPGEITRLAAQLRNVALILQDRVVLADKASGATWEEIGEHLHLDLDVVIHRYARAFDEWEEAGVVPPFIPAGRAHFGLEQGEDWAGTAFALDQWRQRHAEPWETTSPRSMADRLRGA